MGDFICRLLHDRSCGDRFCLDFAQLFRWLICICFLYRLNLRILKCIKNEVLRYIEVEGRALFYTCELVSTFAQLKVR